METTVEMRSADLAVKSHWHSMARYVHLEWNDCEGGTICFRMDRQAAVDIVASLQRTLRASQPTLGP